MKFLFGDTDNETMEMSKNKNAKTYNMDLKMEHSKSADDVEEGYESWSQIELITPSFLKSLSSPSTSFDAEWLEINQTLAANELLVSKLRQSLTKDETFLELWDDVPDNHKTSPSSSKSSTLSSNHATNDSLYSMPFSSLSSYSSSHNFSSSTCSSASTSPSTSFRSSAGFSNSVPITNCQQNQHQHVRSGAMLKNYKQQQNSSDDGLTEIERLKEMVENLGANRHPQCTEIFTRSPSPLEAINTKKSTSSCLSTEKYIDASVDYNHNHQQLQQTEPLTAITTPKAAESEVSVFNQQNEENKQNQSHPHQWSGASPLSPSSSASSESFPPPPELQNENKDTKTKQAAMLGEVNRMTCGGSTSTICSSKRPKKKGFKRLNSNYQLNRSNKSSPLSSIFLRAKATAVVAAVTVRLRRFRGRKSAATLADASHRAKKPAVSAVEPVSKCSSSGQTNNNSSSKSKVNKSGGDAATTTTTVNDNGYGLKNNKAASASEQQQKLPKSSTHHQYHPQLPITTSTPSTRITITPTATPTPNFTPRITSLEAKQLGGNQPLKQQPALPPPVPKSPKPAPTALMHRLYVAQQQQTTVVGGVRASGAKTPLAMLMAKADDQQQQEQKKRNTVMVVVTAEEQQKLKQPPAILSGSLSLVSNGSDCIVPKAADSAVEYSAAAASSSPLLPHHHHSSASLILDKEEKEEKKYKYDDDEEREKAVVSGGNGDRSNTTTDEYSVVAEAAAAAAESARQVTRTQRRWWWWQRRLPMTNSNSAAAESFSTTSMLLQPPPPLPPPPPNLCLKSLRLKRRQNRPLPLLRGRQWQKLLFSKFASSTSNSCSVANEATSTTTEHNITTTTANISPLVPPKRRSKRGERSYSAATKQLLAVEPTGGERQNNCTTVEGKYCKRKSAKNTAVEVAEAASSPPPPPPPHTLPFSTAPELSSNNPKSSSPTPAPKVPVPPLQLDSSFEPSFWGGGDDGGGDGNQPQLPISALDQLPECLPNITTTTTIKKLSSPRLPEKEASSLHRSSIDATAADQGDLNGRQQTATKSSSPSSRLHSDWCRFATASSSSPSLSLVVKRRKLRRRRGTHPLFASSLPSHSSSSSTSTSSTSTSVLLKAAVDQSPSKGRLVVQGRPSRPPSSKTNTSSFTSHLSGDRAQERIDAFVFASSANSTHPQQQRQQEYSHPNDFECQTSLDKIVKCSDSRPLNINENSDFKQSSTVFAIKSSPFYCCSAGGDSVGEGGDGDGVISSGSFQNDREIILRQISPTSKLNHRYSHPLSRHTTVINFSNQTLTSNQLTFSTTSSFPSSILIVPPPAPSRQLDTKFHPSQSISSIPHHPQYHQHTHHRHHYHFIHHHHFSPASSISLKPVVKTSTNRNQPFLNCCDSNVKSSPPPPSLFLPLQLSPNYRHHQQYLSRSLERPIRLQLGQKQSIADLVENLLAHKFSSEVFSRGNLSSSQLIFIRLQALTELMLMSKKTLQHIVTVEHLQPVVAAKKSEHHQLEHDDENNEDNENDSCSFDSGKPKNWVASLQNYLPLFGGGSDIDEHHRQLSNQITPSMDQKMAKMVKSSTSPSSPAGKVDGGGSCKDSSKSGKKESGRPISPQSIFSGGPQPLPTPPTQPTTTKTKTNHFSNIFLRPDRFRSSKSDSAKASGGDQGQNSSSVRRSDSPSINRSTSSVGGSSSALYESSPSGGGGGDHHSYHHHHRPSMPSTTLVKDLNQMEAYLSANQQAHQQQQNTTNTTSSGTDHLSPSLKTTTAGTLPHPSSTPSLNSIVSDHQSGGGFKSTSPTPLPSPVSPVATSNLVTPTTTTTTALRRPSSIGGGRLASNSFTSGGGGSTGTFPLSGGKTPSGGSSSASLNMVAAVGKYPRKVLRGPWGEMLESRMSCSEQLMNFYPLDYHDCGQNNSSSSNRNSVGDPQQFSSSLFSPNQFNYLSPKPSNPTLSFTDELLRQTKVHRAKLDKDSRETVGTASPTEHKPEFPCFVSGGENDVDQSTAAPDDQQAKIASSSSTHPHHSSTDIEESEESEEEANKKSKEDESTKDAVITGESGEVGTSKNVQEVVNTRPLPPTVVVTEVVSAGPSITEAIGRHLDTRAHIVGELYDTEKNYVEVLRTLNESYLRKYRPVSEETTRGSSASGSHSPHSSSSAASQITSSTANSTAANLDHGGGSQQLQWLEFVAARLPPVMDYHGKLLEQLRRRIADWCPDSTPIGDLFHSFFVNVEVLQFYESMVDHLAELSAILKAQYRALEAAASKELAKMAAEKKVEGGSGSGSGSSGSSNQSSQSASQAAAAAKRQSRRLAPDYLLISTIQRIPRYELLLQRLIKNTGEEHADYASLSQALGIIHDVLVKIGTYSSEGSGPSGSQKHDSFNSGGSVDPSTALTTTSASSSAATSPSSSTMPGEPISAVTACVTLSSPQTAISMPISQQQQTMNVDPNIGGSPNNRQLYIRDLEPVVEGAQSALESYSSNGLVHLFEYVTVRKGRERALFVLDDALLLCTVKSKKKADRFEYNKFKMQQLIRLETVDLRCACWQHWIQEAEKAAEKSGGGGSSVSGSASSSGQKIDRDSGKGSSTGNDILGSYPGSLSSGLGGGDHHYYYHHGHHSQQQQLASSGCRACIETLEADIKALLKLQSSVHQITTASIRAGLSAHLTEVVQAVYSQLVEMHETVARCAKDLSVDVYILPTTSNSGDQSNSANLVDPGLYAQGGGGNLLDNSGTALYQPEHYSTSISGTFPSSSSNSSHIFTHHSTSSNSNQITKSVRLVHYKCPRHQPHRFSFTQQQQQQEPEYTFTFSDSRRRAVFEFIVTSLRAQIIKSRLKLHFLRAIPYEKTRAGLQFTCASAANGTNHVWVCKSDGFVGQISVLEVNTTATTESSHHHHHQRTSLLDEPTVISCNGVCNAQIVAMTTVPANSASSSFIPPPPPPPPPSLFASITPPSVHKLLESAAATGQTSESGRSHGRNSSIFTSLGFGRSHSHRSSPQQPVVQHQQQQQQGSLHSFTGDSSCVEETDASEPESEHSTSAAISTRSSRKSQNSFHQQQHSTSPSKSTGSTLFSHLKPKASRTKSTPHTSTSTSSVSLPPIQSSTSHFSQPQHPSLTLQHSISHQETTTLNSSTAISGASLRPTSLPTTQPAQAALPQSSSTVSENPSETQNSSDQANSTTTTSTATTTSEATSKLSISHDCPTMWFGTDDSTIHIYSCFDAVRIGKNKAKVTLNAKVDAIQYFGGKVFVGLANQTVAVFTKDATGYWQTTPTIMENIRCYRFCPVNVGRLNESLWTTSRNVITIRNEELALLEDPIHVDELAEISFIVSNQQSVLLTSANSAYLYRYSPVAPYSRLGTISIGPFVNKALALTEDIIRHHKNACLKVSAMETVQERVWIGTSAGVILVLDNKNTIEIIPNGHTGHVRFITSHRLQDGQGIVVSGGDGYEQFSPGTGSNLAGPTDLFHFMSYCSNLALNLLGRSSSNSNMASAMQQASSSQSTLSTISGGSGSVQSSGIGSSSTLPSPTSSSSTTTPTTGGNRISTLSPSPSNVSGASSLSTASSTSSSVGSSTLVLPASGISGTALTCSESTENLANSEVNNRGLNTTTSCFNTTQDLSNTVHHSHHHHPQTSTGADDSKSYLLIWKI